MCSVTESVLYGLTICIQGREPNERQCFDPVQRRPWRPGEKFDVVTENRLGENCYASPAISDGRIYIRAERHLYCIGPQEAGL